MMSKPLYKAYMDLEKGSAVSLGESFVRQSANLFILKAIGVPQ